MSLDLLRKSVWVRLSRKAQRVRVDSKHQVRQHLTYQTMASLKEINMPEAWVCAVQSRFLLSSHVMNLAL